MGITKAMQNTTNTHRDAILHTAHMLVNTMAEATVQSGLAGGRWSWTDNGGVKHTVAKPVGETTPCLQR